MNIISGIYKNRKIETPLGDKTHPMGSREKLALFNMLTGYFEDTEVLDAYAGSGALGLEAISRGAKSVTFIEKDPKAIRVIKNNIDTLGCQDQTTLIKTDVKNFNPDKQYDLILLDPPYDHYDVIEFNHLSTSLKEGGILVLSHPKTKTAPVFDSLTHNTTKTYAAASISIYKKA